MWTKTKTIILLYSTNNLLGVAMSETKELQLIASSGGMVQCVV